MSTWHLGLNAVMDYLAAPTPPVTTGGTGSAVVATTGSGSLQGTTPSVASTSSAPAVTITPTVKTTLPDGTVIDPPRDNAVVASIITSSVAGIAAAVALTVGLLARRTGKHANENAEAANENGAKQAAAADESARAARDAVAENRRSVDNAVKAVEVSAVSAAAATESARAAQRSADAANKSAEIADRSTTAAGFRAEQDALSKRYQEAANQLGSTSAAVRLAGIYAMAHLADDWQEQRQTCIDVLCAYLRMPWDVEKAPEGKHEGELQVRRAILRLFEIHVIADAQVSWSALRFDFSHAQFWDFGWVGPIFDEPVVFYGARFTGDTNMNGITFRSGATFQKARFEGRVIIRNLVVTGRSILFRANEIGKEAYLQFSTNSVGQDTKIIVENMTVKGMAVMNWSNSAQRQGQYYLRFVRVHPSGTFELDKRSDPDGEATAHLPHEPAINAKFVTAALSATVDVPDSVDVRFRSNDSLNDVPPGAAGGVD